jgi:hypothetical protein
MAAQIHVRVSPEFKRALKIYCAREGITEQRWTQRALETALRKCAPDLLNGALRSQQSATRNEKGLRSDPNRI